MHQILVNLIQNALDAVADEQQPRISIRHEIKDCQFHIQVKDNGTGIEAKNMPHIFEPFFTSKPVGQGTGLGLYISYGLAQDLGGELSARNNLGQGACFTLSLPV